MTKNWITAISIVCIMLLEGYALYRGINGVSLAAGVGAIASLGGFTLGKIMKGGT